jgi:O-antigen ligase
MFLSFLFSGAPKLQMFYGVYARNTGMLNYLALALLFLFASELARKADYRHLLKYFLISSGIVITVCLLEVMGVNVQRVSLIFKGSLIGTFGNPNFISAYLGMCGTVFFVLFLGWNERFGLRLILTFPILLAVGLILKSNSRQGLVVFLGGCAFTFFFYLVLKVKSRVITLVYSSIVGLISIASLLGALKIGPLADLIYKSSVGFRGEYWNAGIEMFKEKPLFGVGLNSYGDWYRTLRSGSAVISPGPEVFTNTAHNVYIDFAATGGIFLLFSYLLLVFVTVKAAIKFYSWNKDFDVIFYSFLGAWVVYMVQAVISIDQIGLAIWGWVLSGAIIGYEKIMSKSEKSPLMIGRESRGNSLGSNLIPASTLLSVVGAILASFLLTFPILKSDFDVRKAYDSTSAELLISAANLWPTNTYKWANISGLLINNNLPSQSLEIAKSGLADNPRSFDLWKLIYLNSTATIEERKEALRMMKRLDPKNPNVIGEAFPK